MMKTYACKDFQGRWPVGTAAVIRAKSEAAAREMLSEALVEEGLKPLKPDAVLTVVKPNTAIILNNGDY